MEVGAPPLGPLRCQELLSSGKSLTRLEEGHAGLILSSECFRLDPGSGSTFIGGAGERRAEWNSVQQVCVMWESAVTKEDQFLLVSSCMVCVCVCNE